MRLRVFRLRLRTTTMIPSRSLRTQIALMSAIAQCQNTTDILPAEEKPSQGNETKAVVLVKVKTT